MDAIRRFFNINARDLNMQKFTTDEIADMMKPVDESDLNLPWGFAAKVSFIFENEEVVAKNTNHNIFQLQHQ